MADEQHELRRFETQSRKGSTRWTRLSSMAPSIDDDARGRSSPFPVSRDLDRRTIRKLDFVLLPFLALLFLCNSLDKSNIGNAETANFTEDIGLEKSDLNTAVAVFFTFFVALQPLGAALGRRYGMSIWVPACMSVWGVCTALHIWVRSKWQLIILRMVIGSLEAGFYPITVSYLSLFYTKFEFGRRLAVFYGQSAVAGALGGVLSYYIFSSVPDQRPENAGIRSLKGWQFLFLIEGCATIIIAVAGFVWLPRSAETAWFLKPDERAWAEERIRLENAMNGSKGYATPRSNGDLDTQDGRHDTLEDGEEEDEGLLGTSSHRRKWTEEGRTTDDRGLSRLDLVSAFLDWKIWYLLACNTLSSVPVSAFSVFLPLVLQPLTGSNANKRQPALTNLLTVPPFLLGAVVLYAFTSYSDRHRIRLDPILIGLGVLLFGLTLTTLLPQQWVIPRYLSLCILVSGSFVASPLQVAWLSNNIWQPGKRSVALGINGWGNLAGVLSALLFQPKYAPRYRLPFFITFVLVGIAAAGYLYFRRWIMKENRRRDHEGIRWSGSRLNASLGSLYSVFRADWIRQLVEEAKEKQSKEEEAMNFRYGL